MVTVRLTKEGRERVERLQGDKVEQKCCLACELPFTAGERVVCGVHVTCDQTQRYAVRKGVTTFPELVKIGERRAPTTNGSRPKTDYGARLLGRPKRVAKAKTPPAPQAT